MVWLIFVLGLVIGSFIGALSYRIAIGIPISKGRSQCPTCRKQIAWYDNIPVLSYFLLGGKCRHCKKSISIRYLLIELATGVIFAFSFLYAEQIASNILWLPANSLYQLAIIVVLVFLSIVIFVVDSEHQIIPDGAVFAMWVFTLIVMILTSFTPIYGFILSGLVAALFLLVVNLATKGKGMGLGDVKLALAIGTVLGPLYATVWIFLSFILGGIVGSMMLVFKHAKIKDKIAFGPFLIISFFTVSLFGAEIVKILFPYL